MDEEQTEEKEFKLLQLWAQTSALGRRERSVRHRRLQAKRDRKIQEFSVPVDIRRWRMDKEQTADKELKASCSNSVLGGY